jgi:hypothetical protein
MKLTVNQLRRIIKEEVSKAVMQEALSDDDKQDIEDAIAPILDKGIPAGRIMSLIRTLEKAAGKRAGHKEGSGKPGSKLHKAGKAAGADIEED